MCVDKKSSMTTFIVSIISCMMTINKERRIAIMFLCTGLMQLGEYFMWDDKHVMGNILGVLSLYLQSSGILIKNSGMLTYIVSIYYLYILKRYIENGLEESTVNENGNMVWGFARSSTRLEKIIG